MFVRELFDVSAPWDLFLRPLACAGRGCGPLCVRPAARGAVIFLAHLIARQQAVAGFVYWGLHRGCAPIVRAGVHASRHPLSSPRLEFIFLV